jgi:hypothetical protein
MSFNIRPAGGAWRNTVGLHGHGNVGAVADQMRKALSSTPWMNSPNHNCTGRDGGKELPL